MSMKEIKTDADALRMTKFVDISREVKIFARVTRLTDDKLDSGGPNVNDAIEE